MDRPTLALIGCGRWGKLVLRDLRELGCEVHVVARSAASIERAREGGAASLVDAIGALPAVDGAVVATGTSTHAAVVGETLGLGVPVFCEKPLSDDPEAAARLAASADGRLFVMDKWRYHPGVEELARIAREQELGPVVGLVCERIGWGNPHDDVDAIWVLVPHDLSIAREILGAVPAARAAAAEPRGAGLTALLGDDPWLQLIVSSTSGERRRAVRLHCREGTAWFADAFADHVGVMRHGAAEPEHRPVGDRMPLLAELEAFVAHLDGGPTPRSSAAEGAEVVARIAELRALAA